MKIRGTVIHGQARRGTLPTLNLDVKPPLEEGVYAVWVIWNEQGFPGAMNWGPQPTFKAKEPVLEIHLLEGEGDWYGREIEVKVHSRVRDVQKFSSKQDLMRQINTDLHEIKQRLNLT